MGHIPQYLGHDLHAIRGLRAAVPGSPDAITTAPSGFANLGNALDNPKVQGIQVDGRTIPFQHQLGRKAHSFNGFRHRSRQCELLAARRQPTATADAYLRPTDPFL